MAQIVKKSQTFVTKTIIIDRTRRFNSKQPLVNLHLVKIFDPDFDSSVFLSYSW